MSSHTKPFRRVRGFARIAGRWCLAAALSCLSVLLVSCPSGEKAAVEPRAFATPEAAVSAFVDAIRKDDVPALRAILGEGSEEILDSGDAVADANSRRRFVEMYDAKNRMVLSGDDTAVLHVGEVDWPFPIPVVRDGDEWFFDTEAGRQEMLDRRIGKNELGAIQVCLAFVDAQREYARTDWDGDGVLEYARKLRSEAGKKDGLFWKVAEGETPTPLGPLVADAVAEGYGKEAAAGERRPYHGYYYKMLDRQGPHAPGGAFEYVVREDMIGGFAFVAWPAEYGSSGVVTFVVNHDGVVYEKDLGDDTEKLASEMAAFDPDDSWKKAQEG